MSISITACVHACVRACVCVCVGGVGGQSGLPSSVMMGMLEPVVTEAWRTKPCTGLLSGDDLSIPGGVKPAQQKQTTAVSGTWKYN